MSDSQFSAQTTEGTLRFYTSALSHGDQITEGTLRFYTSALSHSDQITEGYPKILHQRSVSQ